LIVRRLMHRISRGLAYHCNAFRDGDRRRPEECSRRQRDRVAVVRRVMQRLYIRRRSVGMVNGRPAAQGEQAAENKDKPQDFSRHDTRLTVPSDMPQLLFVADSIIMASDFFLFLQFFSQASADKFMFLYESQTK
jgi:hypothetical protein